MSWEATFSIFSALSSRPLAYLTQFVLSVKAQGSLTPSRPTLPMVFINPIVESFSPRSSASPSKSLRTDSPSKSCGKSCRTKSSDQATRLWRCDATAPRGLRRPENVAAKRRCYRQKRNFRLSSSIAVHVSISLVRYLLSSTPRAFCW